MYQLILLADTGMLQISVSLYFFSDMCRYETFKVLRLEKTFGLVI